MRKVSAAVVAVLMLFVTLRYSWLTWRGEIQPVFATWLLGGVAVSLSFWTYWSSGQRSLVGNIGNTVDLFVVGTILASIVFLSPQVRLGFNEFEIGCLAVSVVILIFWRTSKRHAAAHLALQGLMTVSFCPLFYQLWQAHTNTESFGVWVTAWVACVAALVPPVLDRDRLAIIYASRAIIMVTITLGLMARLELR